MLSFNCANFCCGAYILFNPTYDKYFQTNSNTVYSTYSRYKIPISLMSRFLTIIKYNLNAKRVAHFIAYTTEKHKYVEKALKVLGFKLINKTSLPNKHYVKLWRQNGSNVYNILTKLERTHKLKREDYVLRKF